MGKTEKDMVLPGNILNVLAYVLSDSTTDTQLLVQELNDYGVVYDPLRKSVCHLNEPNTILDAEIVCGLASQFASSHPDIWQGYCNEYNLFHPSLSRETTAVSQDVPYQKEKSWARAGKTAALLAAGLLVGYVAALTVNNDNNVKEIPAAIRVPERITLFTRPEESEDFNLKVAALTADLEHLKAAAEQRDSYLAADQGFAEAQLGDASASLVNLQHKLVQAREDQERISAEHKVFLGQLGDTLWALEQNFAKVAASDNGIIQQMGDTLGKVEGELTLCLASNGGLDAALMREEVKLAEAGARLWICENRLLEAQSLSVLEAAEKMEAKPEQVVVTEAEKRYLTIKDGDAAAIVRSVVEYIDGADGVIDGAGAVPVDLTPGNNVSEACAEARGELFAAMTDKYGAEDPAAKAKFLAATQNMCGKRIDPHQKKFWFKLAKKS